MMKVRKETAFTLIEILVVVSILGVLMGLVVIFVRKGPQHMMEQNAKALVGAVIPQQIQVFEQKFNFYPPMTLEELKKRGLEHFKGLSYADPNSLNESSEVLVVALRHPDLRQKLVDLPYERVFLNTDEDSYNMQPPGFDDIGALEVCDPWGSPIVYFHKSGYDRTVEIVNGEGEQVIVEAVKRPSGVPYNETKFQVISVGPNGRQDLDDPIASDDVVNFQWKERDG